MIPKIIHYCWFGGKSKPQEVLDYIETWKKIMPDYQIKEWNESNFDIKSYQYTKEAYVLKRYAFVSDVCRLYALYEEGGIYLDTDIEVIENFNPYLYAKSFIGYETDDLIGTGVIGAEPQCSWIKSFLDSYRTREFISSRGILDLSANTAALTSNRINYFQENNPRVYAIDYFCAKNYHDGTICKTPNTVCIHHYHASWHGKDRWYETVDCFLEYRLKLDNFHLLTAIIKYFVKLW